MIPIIASQPASTLLHRQGDVIHQNLGREVTEGIPIESPVRPSGRRRTKSKTKKSPYRNKGASLSSNGGFLAAEQFRFVIRSEEDISPPRTIRKKPTEDLWQCPTTDGLDAKSLVEKVKNYKESKSTPSPKNRNPEFSKSKKGDSKARTPMMGNSHARKANSNFQKDKQREGCPSRLLSQSIAIRKSMIESRDITAFMKNWDCRLVTYNGLSSSSFWNPCNFGNCNGENASDVFPEHSNPQVPDSSNPQANYLDDSAEDTLRRKAGRFPEAFSVHPPETVLSDYVDESSLMGIVNIPPPEDSPNGLRKYRLALMLQDRESHMSRVPMSRLARVLGELDIRDSTVDQLQEKLLQSHNEMLDIKHRCEEIDEHEYKYKSSMKDLIEHSVKEKQLLHENLLRESEENSILRSKLSALQWEASQLSYNIRNVRLEMQSLSTKCIDTSQNTPSTPSNVENTTAVINNTDLVTALRWEISVLKAQLEQTRSNTVDGYNHIDIGRLKLALERAENEIQRLADAETNKLTELGETSEELKAVLQKSEQAIELASLQENEMMPDLHEELGLKPRQHPSKHEVSQLYSRIHQLEAEAQNVETEAQIALNKCREDVDGFRLEIHQLKEGIDMERSRANVETTGRAALDKLEIADEAPPQSEAKGFSFAERIKNLEACLEKAEQEALKNSSQDQIDISQSHECQDVLDPSREKESISDQISKVEGDEDKVESNLKDDFLSLKDRLRLAEEKIPIIQEKCDLIIKSSDITTHESSLLKEVETVRNRLKETELALKLEACRAEEERRMSVESNSELRNEIHHLRSELQKLYGGLNSSRRKTFVGHVPNKDVNENQEEYEFSHIREVSEENNNTDISSRKLVVDSRKDDNKNWNQSFHSRTMHPNNVEGMSDVTIPISNSKSPKRNPARRGQSLSEFQENEDRRDFKDNCSDVSRFVNVTQYDPQSKIQQYWIEKKRTMDYQNREMNESFYNSSSHHRDNEDDSFTFSTKSNHSDNTDGISSNKSNAATFIGREQSNYDDESIATSKYSLQPYSNSPERKSPSHNVIRRYQQNQAIRGTFREEDEDEVN